MSLTCGTAAVCYAIAYALLIHGLVEIAAELGEPTPCGTCVVCSTAEVLGAAVLFAGVLAVTGGYL